MNELHSLAGTFRSRHDKLHEQASAVLLCGSALRAWLSCLQQLLSRFRGVAGYGLVSVGLLVVCALSPRQTLLRILLSNSQIEAIKNLNGLVRKTQGIMQTTKKSYEAAVQARNATGERQH